MASDSNADGSVDLSLSRHDNHNLEIKLNLNLPQNKFKSSLQVYLYFSKTLAPSMFSKAELMSDFRSRSRLALSDDLQTESEDFQDKISELFRCLTLSQTDQVQLLVQWVGAVGNERFKQDGRALTRNYLLLTALFSRALESPAHVEQRISHTIENARSLRQQIRDLVGPHYANPWVRLLESYSHQGFLSFLSCLDELIQSSTRHTDFEERLRVTYRQLVSEEKSHSSLFPPEQANLCDSEKLTYLSQMKKFFQSALFVDIQKRSGVEKLQEPAAVAGTALAGVTAASMQMLSENSGWHMSASSTMLFTLGVVLYVFRDRLKDWARAQLQKHAFQYIPDVEQNLVVNGKSFGVATERLRATTPLSAPDDIQFCRLKASQSLLESALPEEVVYYQYNQKCNKPKDSKVQDNIRINLHRYLKLMDDPVKDVTVLDENGELSRRKSKKMYRVWVVMKEALEADGLRTSHTQSYRVDVDKFGIQSVEKAPAPLSSQAL